MTGLPVLGSAPALSKDLIAFVVRQYQRLGPVFRIRVLNREMVILAGPEANAFVTQEGMDKFSSREAWTSFGQEFGVETYLQNIDGEPHAQMRKMAKPGYAVGTLMANIPVLVDIAQKVIERFQPGEEVAALHLCRLIVTEQLGTALAGRGPGDELPNIVTSLRTALNVHVLKRWPAFLLRLPSYRRANQRYLRLGREILTEHRTTSRTRRDLIDDILAASQDDRFADLLGSEAQCTFAALGPFVAGLDTVANECTFMFYALLQHPDILHQCVEEADQFFASGLPTLQQVRSLGVLHYTMMETLRRYPIAPAVFRTAAKTFEFAGCQIKQGQTVLLASSAAHFLPELFPEPYTFDVTRYSEPRKEHKQRGAYAPFGVGTHLCLGAGAAEAQMVLVLASILHMARLERAEPMGALRVKNDPTLTLGNTFRIRIAEIRHHVEIAKDTLARGE